MASCSPVFSPTLLPFSSTIKPSKCPYFHYKTKELLVPSISVASISYPLPPQPLNVDYLENEFSGHGVTFEGIGESCVAKMGLENGSSAILMLPSGLITSYKAAMWHGGTDELLHSSVSEDASGAAAIEGGVSLAFNLASFDGDGDGDGDQVSCTPTNWAVQDIRGDSKDSIQVELICPDAEDMVELKYIVTLEEDVLSSELVISNSKASPLQLTGSILSHLTVSSPDATFAIGLEGSDFIGRRPFLSNFSIIPPDFGQKKIFGFSQLWNQISLWGPRNENNVDETKSIESETEEEIVGEENDGYKHLREQMSQIYTSAPRNFTVIDRVPFLA
ncbi:hypothetical protein FEM48_Zijuj07G0174200 [Ziziphus jujuba var. spinosa]|uniref:Protein NDH-DEPENDENT CYCLIC ELECTRON FLOW 5 n=1 Tax=Ziziphus jujuba var. spinosa TaxID=714518 RepID=A0A978V5Z2_ZIZJJ|nr:hypothetical protein FEM48_Zijuj07G0174200 [Ziziphus jujuba var. spinosa]